MKVGFFLREALRSVSRNAVPSFAAPVVAWTIGMKTPRTSTVTSTLAIAAKLGTALRPTDRSASRRKKPGRTGG